MKAWIVTGALVVALGMAAPAWAQCCKAGDATAQKASSIAEKLAAKAKAPADVRKCSAAGMSCCATPTMAYKVGEETTECSKTAAALAGKTDGKVKYVVAGQEYSDKGEAMSAYADALEAHLKQSTSVRYMVGDKCVACPLEAKSLASGNGGTIKYCVAAAQFDDMAKAQHAAKLAGEAADKVEMKMVIDGQPYTCPKQAKAVCDKTGKRCEYSVGDCKTDCPTTARIELAKARIDAARASVATESVAALPVQP